MWMIGALALALSLVGTICVGSHRLIADDKGRRGPASVWRRGYEIREIRTVASQWAHALSQQDADRWLREHQLEMTVSRKVAS